MADLKQKDFTIRLEKRAKLIQFEFTGYRVDGFKLTPKEIQLEIARRETISPRWRFEY